jgi:hypothetical protein
LPQRNCNTSKEHIVGSFNLVYGLTTHFSVADTLTVAGIFSISSLLSHLLSIYLPKTSTGYQSFGA